MYYIKTLMGEFCKGCVKRTREQDFSDMQDFQNAPVWIDSAGPRTDPCPSKAVKKWSR
jgi:hypothetical protein